MKNILSDKEIFLPKAKKGAWLPFAGIAMPPELSVLQFSPIIRTSG